MENTILLLGGDGYFGWPLAMKIAVKYPAQKVIIIDNEWRRNTVSSLGFQTLIPIAKPEDRIAAFTRIHGQKNLHYIHMDVNSDKLEGVIQNEKPHTIFHLAQQCSASFSMKGMEEALYTINNNESGNMRLLWAVRKHVPDAHIIKLGSFGEYAKGGIDIAEGYFFPEHNGKVATSPMPYPRAADDIYHISKINDSNYVAMACRLWKLRITDVMQSTIFGFTTEEMAGCEELYTRCDYDCIFGTVLNRFLVQAVCSHPLTVYGKGHQRTGLMALKDAVNSLVGLIDNIPDAGTHKVINHVTETNYSINELAKTVKNIAEEQGFNVNIVRSHDPRMEQNETKSEYGIETNLSGHDSLHTPLAEIAKEMMKIIAKFRDNISPGMFTPSVQWNADINNNTATVNHISPDPAPEKTYNYDRNNNSDNNKVRKVPHYYKISADNESYWESFREQYFQSDRVNLNPGMLGATSIPVKNIYYQNLSNSLNGFPLGNYEYARKSHGEISRLCAEIWPSEGYKLTVTHSTSQTMNLLALSMLRKFNKTVKGPVKVITTTHEHEGGIGSFEHLPEYEVHYIEDAILANPPALGKIIKDLQPDLALFSHVFYDTGNIAPVENWCANVRKNAPSCKIILDVAQSLGLYDLPFGCSDLVLGSTHKWLHGPQGGGLMWMTVDFQNWIEKTSWSGHGLGYTPDTEQFSIPGGQDFMLYPALEEALKLYKKAGLHNVLARSSQLGTYFQKKLDEVFSKNGINHVFLNNKQLSPVITIAFTDYDPYLLYKYMNAHQVHAKLIKNHKISGVKYHILRIGIPYFESYERLEFALNEIKKYLYDKKKTKYMILPLIKQPVAVAKNISPNWYPDYNINAYLN